MAIESMRVETMSVREEEELVSGYFSEDKDPTY